MEDVSTLFSIIDLIATSVSERSWKLYRTDGVERGEEVTSHPALEVWGNPNSFYTQDELCEAIIQHYELTGEMWLLLESKTMGRLKMPTDLWPLRPDRMAPVKHPRDFVSGYIYSLGGDKIPLDVEQVIFDRRMNPQDPWRGLSPISSLSTDIAGEKAAARFNTLFFVNGAEPGGVIELGENNVMDDDDFERFRKHWESSHKGYSNAHRVAILEMGKYTERKITHREMEFVGLRTFSRESMMEAYRVSKSMLGHVDDVNMANNRAQAASFDAKIVTPRLNRVRRMLNSKLLPRFGTMGIGYEFDYEVPETDDPDALTASLAAVKALVDLGFDVQAAAAAYGLPDLPLAPKAEVPEMLKPFVGAEPEEDVDIEDEDEDQE